MGRFDRRGFLTASAAIAAIAPPARAQQTRRPVVGFLGGGTRERDVWRVEAVVSGLASAGRERGRDYELVARYADSRLETLPEVAADLARQNPDVIVTSIIAAVLAARKAAPRVPVVAAVLTQPVEFGVIESFPRPGGMVTGIMSAIDGMAAKQFEVALDLVPGLAKVGVLGNANNIGNPQQRAEIEATARERGVATIAIDVTKADDYASAFSSFKSAGAGAVVALRDTLVTTFGERVAQEAARTRLPTVYSFRESVEAGGLINYGVNLLANYRRAAYFVDRILSGVKAGDLPVEFPTRFEMVINMKTARALGIEIPPTLLVRAEEVIE